MDQNGTASTAAPGVRTGHALLASRLAQCPEILAGMMATPWRPARDRPATSFVVTGTGSSEAHARFLMYLLQQYTPASAEFWHLSRFAGSPSTACHDKTLVVFSQGLSANARLALGRSSWFRHVVLFTATTSEGARARGQSAKLEVLERAGAAGHDIVWFPIEDEYTVLMRVIGPLAGYMAAVQFVDALFPGCLPACPPERLVASLHSGRLQGTSDEARAVIESGRDGLLYLAGAPSSEHAHNLAYKLLEGLYWPVPPVWDYMQFAHGPFQQWVSAPRPIIVLHGDSRAEADCLARVRKMLGDRPGPLWVVSSSLPPCYRIFEYEMAVNELVVAAIASLGIDQIEWPGKGQDGPLYHLDVALDELEASP